MSHGQTILTDLKVLCYPQFLGGLVRMEQVKKSGCCLMLEVLIVGCNLSVELTEVSEMWVGYWH